QGGEVKVAVACAAHGVVQGAGGVARVQRARFRAERGVEILGDLDGDDVADFPQCVHGPSVLDKLADVARVLGEADADDKSDLPPARPEADLPPGKENRGSEHSPLAIRSPAGCYVRVLAAALVRIWRRIRLPWATWARVTSRATTTRR